MTYVGYHYWWNRKLDGLHGNEAYLLRGKKYFNVEFDSLVNDFARLHWITYCDKFKPLLIELGKWQGKHVTNPTTDNNWGCTLRCLQMLVANSLGEHVDILALFDNDVRGKGAAFSIQNIAEVGLKEFGVYPG